jgi:hypothetical protein
LQLAKPLYRKGREGRKKKENSSLRLALGEWRGNFAETSKASTLETEDSW